MLLISTHNSATGEKAHGFLSWLLTPFAKCQSKTLEQQYQAGCRHFDIRIVYDEDKELRTAHGPWRGPKFYDILKTLGNIAEEHIYITVTYEGTTDSWTKYIKQKFIDIIFKEVYLCNKLYDHDRIWLIEIGAKTPYDTILWTSSDNHPKVAQVFKGIFWGTWRFFLPIPWIYAKLYKHPDFNENYFTQIDFL